MARRIGKCIAALASAVLIAATASAQTSGASSIAGVVKDASGGVLPGVTVEASSPALIEKSRTAVTNNQGQYSIVDLRPGTYTLAFSLVGFGTLKREGLELTSNFTATVNVDLKLGSIEETVVVTGQSPIVDVQNVTTATRLSRDTIDQIPTNKGNMALIALMPSAVSAPNTQDVGGSKGEFGNKAVVHGGKGGDQKFMQDGMRWNGSYGSGNGSGFYINPAAAQEVVIEAGSGGSAEYAVGGVTLNVIPKDGGNKFSGYFNADYTGDKLEANNLRANIIDRGLDRVNHTTDIYSVNMAGGGPIKKDTLWFYTAHRWEGNTQNSFVNYYFNASPNPLIYIKDVSRPGFAKERNVANQLRLTWKATSKDKISITENLQQNCNCPNNETVGLTPEALIQVNRGPASILQATWNNPVTNKLLLEGGASWLNFQYRYELPLGASQASAISVNDTGTGLRYNAPATWNDNPSPNINLRAAASFVNGAHYLKAGVFWMWGRNGQFSYRSTTNLAYTFVNGVPNTITEYANPLHTVRILKPDMGLFVQDRWTKGRLTISPGLRLDWLSEYVPPSTQAGNIFVPARSFDRVDCVPCWRDLNPRLAVAYDLFGKGKTAVSASIGRYVATEVSTTAGQNDPVVTSVNNVNRSWTDDNKNLIPDCDLTNPARNLECGPINSASFGGRNITTRYDPDLNTGWGKRAYSWRSSMEIKHELKPGVAVNAGYFRTWYGNFRVTDSLNVVPADYDPFCVTAPPDPRLPGGGNYQVCGQYNLNPLKFGLPTNNYVTWAKNFGKQTEVYNGADFLIAARLPKGGILQGGVNIGNSAVTSVNAGTTTVSATERCFVVDTPQELFQCKVNPPYLAQFKIIGAYQLPWDLQVSANVQSLPGPVIDATWAAPSSAVTGLGRPLTGGSTVPVQLLDPFSLYEDRIFQVDVRLAKKFKIKGVSAQGQFDVYNLANANTVLSSQTAYGAVWTQPTEILNARIAKIGMQLSF